MTAPPGGPPQPTNALFARVVRDSERVVVPINRSASTGNAEMPAFYCVHSLSGVAGTDFVDLAQLLDSTVQAVMGIQAPPKLIDNEQFGDTIESIAGHYADAVLKFQPNGPFVLGGYCVGVVIALAMAKTLRARGHEVGPLIAIDGVPENTGAIFRRWTPRYLLEDCAHNLRGWVVHTPIS